MVAESLTAPRVDDPTRSRVQAILDALPDGVMLVGADGRIAHVNQQAELLLGFESGGLLGRPLESLLPEDAQHLGVATTAEDGESPIEIGWRRQDGVPLEVSLERHVADPELRALTIVRAARWQTSGNGRATEAREVAALARERDRLSEVLHDTVIHRLFGVGLAIQTVASLVTPRRLASRLQAAVDELDAAIRDLRAAIFGLRSAESLDGELRLQVFELLVGASDSLGVVPRLHVIGWDQSQLPGGIRAELLRALEEALGLAAVPGCTTKVEVHLQFGDRVRMTVIGDATPGESRAHTPGLKILRNGTGGAVFEWEVPAGASRPAQT